MASTLKICLGAARGLDYLHTGTCIDFGVIHRDIKSSNILLHETWAAKISDFGLSRLAPTNQSTTSVKTLVKGTFGYLDPNYYTTGKLTRKSDVYAFGVVLLEVLCRKRAVDKSLDEDQWGLVAWVQDSIKEGNLKHIIDTEIKGQISSKCLKLFVRIAEKCLHSRSKQRPTMSEVVASLESVLILQEKTSNLMQTAGRRLIGRMLSKIRSPSGTHGDSKLAGNNSKGTNRYANTFRDRREVSADANNPSRNLNVFKFADLAVTTRNFSVDMELGEGDFGKVFLGWIDQKMFLPSTHGVGIAVAVKRLNHDGFQGFAEWWAEVNFLGRLAHPNIISLLGYCSDQHECLLVYEYMQNQSFDAFLFTIAPEPLSWGTRLTIMIGIARGLTYLHSSKDQVIHRDVNSSNILLDQGFNAKLGDFGLAKSGPEIGKIHVTTRVVGTNGYVGPEYAATGHLSVKSDIYGFGVVLLETLTGQKAIDSKRPKGQHNLVHWAGPMLANRRKIMEIMDPRLEHNYPQEAAFQCATLILKCLASRPKDRPSSEEVWRNLEQIYIVKE